NRSKTVITGSSSFGAMTPSLMPQSSAPAASVMDFDWPQDRYRVPALAPAFRCIAVSISDGLHDFRRLINGGYNSRISRLTQNFGYFGRHINEIELAGPNNLSKTDESVVDREQSEPARTRERQGK